MQNTKFYFRQGWCEAISELPEELQGEVYSAIVNYILKGIYPVSKVARCIFTFLKKEFDKERNRLLRKSEPKPEPAPASELVARNSDLTTPSDLVPPASSLITHTSDLTPPLPLPTQSLSETPLPSARRVHLMVNPMPRCGTGQHPDSEPRRGDVVDNLSHSLPPVLRKLKFRKVTTIRKRKRI